MSVTRVPAATNRLGFFCQLFGLKLWCTYAIVSVATGSAYGAYLMVGAVASLALCFAKWRQIGALIWVCMQGEMLYETWPFHLNHFTLEWFVLLLLTLGTGRRQSIEEHSLCRALKILVISLWVYAGLQKIVHGQYLNGEFFAYNALFDQGDFGESLRFLVRLVSQVTGATSEYDWFGAIIWRVEYVRLSDWELSFFKILGSSVPVVEIMAPMLLLQRNLRPFGVVLLYFIQAVLAITSGEWDFALTGFLLLSLFHEKFRDEHAAIVFVAIATKLVWHL